MNKKIITISLLLVVAALLALPGIVKAGSLDPTGSPAPTMKTLDEIYTKLNQIEASINQNTPAKWKITGITFVDWPANPRFAVFDDGSPSDTYDDLVLDKETGLIWDRDTSGWGNGTWSGAFWWCYYAPFPMYIEEIGQVRGGFRIPTVDELTTLFPLYDGHPFILKEEAWVYWTSTEDPDDSTRAIGVLRYSGHVNDYTKSDYLDVIHVRGR
jgi:hypothetical protein